MKVFIALLICCIYLPSPSRQARTVTLDLDPFLAQLTAIVENDLNESAEIACDGTVLSSKFVFTVAHCIYKAAKVKIIVTTVDHALRDRYSSNYHIHPQFNTKSKDYDVGLVVVPYPLKLGSLVKAMPVMMADTDLSKMDSVLTSGQAVGKRAVVEIPLIKAEECLKAYGTSKITLTSRMFCGGYAGNKVSGLCNGNAGSPAVDDSGTQVGILIHGFGCQLRKYPGIYVQVGIIRPWITSITGI